MVFRRTSDRKSVGAKVHFLNFSRISALTLSLPSEKSEERQHEHAQMQLCPNCGGEVTYTEHTSALQCPYCDHYIILDERVEGAYAPGRIIPFKMGKESVKALIREKFKKT